jgi:ADP-ribose pyrophosphatase YjhB (NUDIX family)
VATSTNGLSLRIRATAILVEDGCILLVEQRVTSSRRWSLPGGTLEAGETLEACLVREMKEETGLLVGIERLLYVCDRIEEDRHVVHITFAVRRLGGSLSVGGEPEEWANPIRTVRMVPIGSLAEYGLDRRFCVLAENGFPDAGSYRGLIGNIGL